MNIIDTLKAKAFTAFCNSETCLRDTDGGCVSRETAILWYGEGAGLINALHYILGSYVDTKTLDDQRKKIEDLLWPDPTDDQ